MASHVPGIAWPPVLAGRAATLAALLHQLNESQWLPAAELEKRQYERLAVLAAHSFAHSPYFQQRMTQAGLTPDSLASPEGLRRLPPLTRRDAQAMTESMRCRHVPPSHLPLTETKTSGSTGEPLVVRKTMATNLFWQANMLREHSWHERDFSGGVLAMRGVIAEPVRYESWGEPINLLYKSGPTLGIPVTTPLSEQLRIIREFKPNHLIIYPNNLEALITLCQKENVTIDFIDHIWSICEALSPQLRQKAERFFNCKVEDDYSSQEVGIIALQCPKSGLLHVMSESVILEVVDEKGDPCREGEVGSVIVTDLNNFATPFIRYALGDLAEVGPACPCGRGLPTLKAIRGRNRNLVVKPDGSRHWPPVAVAFFKAKLPVQQFQMIQHSLEEIEVRLVTERPLSKDEEDKLGAELTGVFTHPFAYRYVYFNERIPPAANGKFEEFTCMVS